MRLSPFEEKKNPQLFPTGAQRLYISGATWTWSSWKALNSRITTQAELFLSPLTFDPLNRALCWQPRICTTLGNPHAREGETEWYSDSLTMTVL